MARGELFPVVNCVDLATTWRWYARVLSGVVDYRFPERGEPDYLTLRIGAGQVALGRGTAPALYGETPRPATGHAVDLCLYVPDLAAVVEAAADAVVVPPADMPWGERVAYLLDPEGIMLLVIQDADSNESGPS
ncbi:bleomycin resistance protein [Cryobacterium zongtaii]|uniref:Bleomycin resistance protein n=1 Tax=Cryobacterium zongtaii TaxID=1259217 RepID=A0A2S3ZMT8_9MICO|nr:VOC family protein [Cryobacterium zongtaii]POH70235.1 bleomycin resistance protein [Cryobacterium zongtaii]